jgi:uncharacterized protein YdaU (DUF1376 family)
MWWIDRWRKSSAYMDMNLEQQGAFRNLLDECWLREGAIPDNETTLAKACGDPTRWSDLKSVLMPRFYRSPGGWRNETLDEVLHQARRRADNQAAYRARKRQGKVQ